MTALKLHYFARSFWPVFVLTLTVSGCGRREMSPDDMAARENLRDFGRILVEFSGQHRGRMPNDKKELMQFLKKRKLKDEEIARLTISPRDHSDYRVKYGQILQTPDFNKNEPWPLVAAESEGVKGSVLTFSFSGFVGTSEKEWVDSQFTLTKAAQ